MSTIIDMKHSKEYKSKEILQSNDQKSTFQGRGKLRMSRVIKLLNNATFKYHKMKLSQFIRVASKEDFFKYKSKITPNKSALRCARVSFISIGIVCSVAVCVILTTGGIISLRASSIIKKNEKHRFSVIDQQELHLQKDAFNKSFIISTIFILLGSLLCMVGKFYYSNLTNENLYITFQELRKTKLIKFTKRLQKTKHKFFDLKKNGKQFKKILVQLNNEVSECTDAFKKDLNHEEYNIFNKFLSKETIEN